MNRIKSKAEEILDELSKSQYGITEEKYNRLVRLLCGMQVIQDSDKHTCKLYTYETNTKVGEVNTYKYGGCFVLQHPPVYVGNSYKNVRPVVQVFNFTDSRVYVSCVYHELSHLFSIGDWNFDEDKVTHYSGLLYEEYRIYERRLSKTKQLHYLLADEVNDWVAMKLFQKMEHKDYYFAGWQSKHKNMEYISKRVNVYCEGNYCKFIGWYFSNNVEMIEKALCCEEFASLNEVENFFMS